MQSDELDDRSTLIKRFSEYEANFKSTEVKRPENWNGYIVEPYLMEFWQDMPFRLHDRVEYRKEKENWVNRKLYP